MTEEKERVADVLTDTENKRRKRKWSCWSVILLMILFLAVCVQGCDMRYTRIVKTWPQPEHLKYDGRVYYFTVCETRQYIPSLPSLLLGLSGSRDYFIFIGKEEKPSYGHFIAYTFHSGNDDKAVKNTVVDWQEDGITLTTPSGHVLFIPEESFTGGR